MGLPWTLEPRLQESVEEEGGCQKHQTDLCVVVVAVAVVVEVVVVVLLLLRGVRCGAVPWPPWLASAAPLCLCHPSLAPFVPAPPSLAPSSPLPPMSLPALWVRSRAGIFPASILAAGATKPLAN